MEGSRLAATRSGALRCASRLTLVLAALTWTGFAPDAFAQQRRVWIPPEPTPTEKLVTLAVQAGVCLWVFVLGSVIGSYLNVVAYRLPQGKPLFWPPSSCPACGSRIAVRDNVPVLGWILLEGRCRNCRQPISPRYPIVEAVVGGLFLLLAAVELFTDGGNLPFRETSPAAGVVSTLLFPKPAMIAQYLFHAAWLSTLVAVVLIDLDRQPPPAKKMLGWMGTIAVVSVAFLPDLLPVKLTVAGWKNGRIEAAATSLAGIAVGLGLGWLRERRAGGAISLVLGLTGAYLGWQAAVAVLLLGTGLQIAGVIGWGAAKGFSRPSPGRAVVTTPSVWIAAGALLHLLVWRWWTGVSELPGPLTPWWTWLLYLLVLPAVGARRSEPTSESKTSQESAN